jgi:hypothetical protein
MPCKVAPSQDTAPASGSLLAQRHDAFLAALAQNAHGAHVQTDLRELETDQLGHAQARGVQGLQHCAVAQAQRRLGIGCFEQRLDLRLGKILGQPARKLRRLYAQRRIGDRSLRGLEAVEAAQRRESPVDRADLRLVAELCGKESLDVGACGREQILAGVLCEPICPGEEIVAIAGDWSRKPIL